MSAQEDRFRYAAFGVTIDYELKLFGAYLLQLEQAISGADADLERKWKAADDLFRILQTDPDKFPDFLEQQSTAGGEWNPEVWERQDLEDAVKMDLSR